MSSACGDMIKNKIIATRNSKQISKCCCFVTVCCICFLCLSAATCWLFAVCSLHHVAGGQEMHECMLGILFSSSFKSFCQSDENSRHVGNVLVQCKLYQKNQMEDTPPNWTIALIVLITGFYNPVGTGIVLFPKFWMEDATRAKVETLEFNQLSVVAVLYHSLHWWKTN